MRSPRHFAVVAVVAMTTAFSTLNISARESCSAESMGFWIGAGTPSVYSFDDTDLTIHIVKTPTDGGIREDIPGKYHERYERWKSELLSTEVGREQWERYSN